MPDIVKRDHILMGIITVPAANAQQVADRMVEAGIVGIFNFAPTDLKVPEGVVVRNERMAVGIMALSFKVKCILESRLSESPADEVGAPGKTTAEGEGDD